LKHALSFDIEDWFHIPGIPHVERRGEWDKFSELSVVEEKTHLILNILDEYDTKATFFILGWIAQKYPGLVKEIASSGHEIASHGYWHYRVYTLNKESFKNYLQQSIHILEEGALVFDYSGHGMGFRGYEGCGFRIRCKPVSRPKRIWGI